MFAGTLLTLALAGVGMRTRALAYEAELTRRLGPVAAPQVDESVVTPPSRGPLKAFLARAGAPTTQGRFLLLTTALTALGLALAFWLLEGPPVLLGILPGFLPWLSVLRSTRARSRQITHQLPDALDLMVRVLRSGHALTDAIHIAGEESPAPFGSLLRHTAEQHRLGLGLRAGLTDMLERVPPNFELRMFVTAVMLKDTGGNLIAILEQLAETVRERIVFEGKVKALTAEVRMSAYVLEALPVGTALLLLVAEPDYLLPLLDPGLGRVLLLTAVVLMTAGVVAMRRIAQVEM